MSTRAENEKIAVIIDSGASKTVASVEMIESYPIEKAAAAGRTQLGSKQKTLSTLVRDTFESSTTTARRVGPSSRCAEDSAKTGCWKRQQVGRIRTLGGDQGTYKTTPTAAGRTCGSTTGPATLICG